MDLTGFSATGQAIAGGAITIALIETLVAKGVLGKTEAKAVLERAVEALSPRKTTVGVGEAINLIRERMIPRFT